eukprot:TRINITY_DN4221_c0_g1_i5.p1 TRINITY_DN4221_c0_g1~~TRINITY_DN4221_c0_g1_i5.p1  ORF type:complete len:785 (+),score=144.26 TRINITY_DN4221_c0_g1_i5:258-2612(+)
MEIVVSTGPSYKKTRASPSRKMPPTSATSQEAEPRLPYKSSNGRGDHHTHDHEYAAFETQFPTDASEHLAQAQTIESTKQRSLKKPSVSTSSRLQDPKRTPSSGSLPTPKTASSSAKTPGTMKPKPSVLVYFSADTMSISEGVRISIPESIDELLEACSRALGLAEPVKQIFDSEEQPVLGVDHLHDGATLFLSAKRRSKVQSTPVKYGLEHEGRGTDYNPAATSPLQKSSLVTSPLQRLTYQSPSHEESSNAMFSLSLKDSPLQKTPSYPVGDSKDAQEIWELVIKLRGVLRVKQEAISEINGLLEALSAQWQTFVTKHEGQNSSDVDRLAPGFCNFPPDIWTAVQQILDHRAAFQTSKAECPPTLRERIETTDETGFDLLLQISGLCHVQRRPTAEQIVANLLKRAQDLATVDLEYYKSKIAQTKDDIQLDFDGPLLQKILLVRVYTMYQSAKIAEDTSLLERLEKETKGSFSSTGLHEQLQGIRAHVERIRSDTEILVKYHVLVEVSHKEYLVSLSMQRVLRRVNDHLDQLDQLASEIKANVISTEPSTRSVVRGAFDHASLSGPPAHIFTTTRPVAWGPTSPSPTPSPTPSPSHLRSPTYAHNTPVAMSSIVAAQSLASPRPPHVSSVHSPNTLGGPSASRGMNIHPMGSPAPIPHLAFTASHPASPSSHVAVNPATQQTPTSSHASPARTSTSVHTPPAFGGYPVGSIGSRLTFPPQTVSLVATNAADEQRLSQQSVVSSNGPSEPVIATVMNIGALTSPRPTHIPAAAAYRVRFILPR